MSGIGNFASGLYSGKVSYNFVGRRRLWYTVSGIILAITLGSLVFRGLNLGIEFEGGSEFQVPNAECSIEDARTTTNEVAGGESTVTLLGDGTLRIQTQDVTPAVGDDVIQALAPQCGVEASDIRIQLVGPTWGSDVSRAALQGLIVFLILVTIFLSIYFEWKMAVGALVALAHDLIITIGVYSLLGFEVTPATAIGVLTILGYSLYDTVVVFDKVKENVTGVLGQSRLTYPEAANLAVNQTLIRSINTSIVALLPVGAILFVGAWILGAGTLKDLALALFVGMAAGTYSSICVATPLLVQLKESEPEVQALARRVAARRRKADEPGEGQQPVAAPVASPAELSRTVSESSQRQQPKRSSRSRRRR